MVTRRPKINCARANDPMMIKIPPRETRMRRVAFLVASGLPIAVIHKIPAYTSIIKKAIPVTDKITLISPPKVSVKLLVIVYPAAVPALPSPVLTAS